MGKENGIGKVDAKVEQLRTPEGNFWISPDLMTHVGFDIDPGQTVQVPVHITDLHLPMNLAKPDLLTATQSQTRSRLMQLGLELGITAGPSILDSLEIDIDGTVHADVPLQNVGYRAIHVPEDVGIGNLFFWNGRRLHNNDLMDHIESGDIRIEGEEGTDWQWKYAHDKDKKRLIGIDFLLEPTKRFYIPPSNEILDLADFLGAEYRDKIDTVLEPVPDSETDIFWIGETKAKLHLSKNVHGIIIPDLDGHPTNHHRNSLLLQGGRTNWSIRTEQVSPTVADKIPLYLPITFAKAA